MESNALKLQKLSHNMSHSLIDRFKNMTFLLKWPYKLQKLRNCRIICNVQRRLIDHVTHNATKYHNLQIINTILPEYEYKNHFTKTEHC